MGIIKEQRKEQRLYKKHVFRDEPSDICLSPKIEELKTIFEENGEMMEWERIMENSVDVLSEGYGI